LHVSSRCLPYLP